MDASKRPVCAAWVIGVACALAACGPSALPVDGVGGAGGGAGLGGASGGAGGVGPGGPSGGAGGAGPGGASGAGVAGAGGGAGGPAAGPLRALALATGSQHTCALLDNHRVKCWGANVLGQLGYGDGFRRGSSPSDMGNALPFVDLGTGRTATAIAGGGDTSCAILDDGAVKCWGDGLLTGLPADDAKGDGPGEMGDALPALDLGGHAARRIVMSARDACVLIDDDTARCWGVDAAGRTPGQVTIDTTRSVRALAPAGKGFYVLYGDGSVGSLLTVGVPGSWRSRVIGIAGHGNHYPDEDGGGLACAVVDGTPDCVTIDASGATSDFGDADLFEPMLPAPRAVGVGFNDQFRCVLLEGGNVQCTYSSSAYPCTPDWCVDFVQFGASVAHFRVNLGQPALSITMDAWWHTCALLTNGAVRCFGMLNAAFTGDAIGSSFDLSVVNGMDMWGPFHDVDLGTAP